MPIAATDVPAAPIVALMAIGVIIAVIGHASKNRSLVITGLAILFIATAAMVLGAYIAFEGGETDPRDLDDPKEPNL